MSRRPWLNKLFFTLILVIALGLLLILTNPNGVPLPVLIVPFLIIGGVIYITARLILDSRIGHMPPRAARLFALSLAFLGVALLLLRSLHQLTLKDTLLVCGFTLAFWAYVWRADFLHK